ncbi:hypothetical protein GCM10010260_74770 [Streptomyces filipinensis]|uniref:Uncharacterized protein n=1 Tax=Streptomyces filipinensis TaxID=66887 RepID=A0A918MFT7_9ACTN|nr:hypothetical protein GCM10010260_74770 [Streptomyces filipinensis]
MLTCTAHAYGVWRRTWAWQRWTDGGRDPDDSGASGMRNLAASLKRVAATGERDAMTLQRYDVENAERPGEWEERCRRPSCTPAPVNCGS